MEFKTLDVRGWEAALMGMRNPLKSYSKYDTYKNNITGSITIGSKDYKLAKSLWKGGTEHRKWLRMIWVWVDISAPRYWWSEWDTYKIGGITANSESTMHTLLNENLDENDFEWPKFEGADWDIQDAFKDYLDVLKTVRDRANADILYKEYYQQMLKGMLPESFIQKRTICVNYETLATMYRQRKNHRLPQWRETFVFWIKSLPYSEFITGDFDE